MTLGLGVYDLRVVQSCEVGGSCSTACSLGSRAA